MKSKVYFENDHIRIMCHSYISIPPILILSFEEPINDQYGKWSGFSISIGVLCWAIDINF